MPRDLIRLNSTGTKKDGKKTGTFRTTSKNKREHPEKIRQKFYDAHAYNPETGKCGMHVYFEEGKIK